jgi:hypothetical protein
MVVAALAMGCSNDSPVAPTSLNNDADLQSSASAATSGAPAEGIVVEGVSVPGVALGDTRAQVEDAYGDPLWCQSVEEAGDRASCAFPVIGGGQVDVRYRGPDGGHASNSPDDIVRSIRWYEAVSGWITTAGVNTTLAKENPEAVVAAYPDARVTYTQWGTVYSIVAYEQGIGVLWAPDFYRGTTHIHMWIGAPGAAPPEPQLLTRVTDIDLTATKVKGKREIRALVRVQNEKSLAAAEATVFARWSRPDGSTQAVEDVTSGSGYAYFEIIGAARGTHTLTVEDVVLDGYEFDRDNSVLSGSIKVK